MRPCRWSRGAGFPDHHRFSAAERAALLAEAERLGADLVTTEKDRVRLPADFPALTLPVSLAFADETPLDGSFGSAYGSG